MARKRKNFWGEAKVGAVTKRKPTPCKNCGCDRYLDENGLCYTTCSPKENENRD